MKKLLAIFISVFALFALVSCTEELLPDVVDFSESQVKSTKITVWMDDSDGLFMEQLIPAFNAEYPDIEVQFQHMVLWILVIDLKLTVFQGMVRMYLCSHMTIYH